LLIKKSGLRYVGETDKDLTSLVYAPLDEGAIEDLHRYGYETVLYDSKEDCERIEEKRNVFQYASSSDTAQMKQMDDYHKRVYNYKRQHRLQQKPTAAINDIQIGQGAMAPGGWKTNPRSRSKSVAEHKSLKKRRRRRLSKSS